MAYGYYNEIYERMDRAEVIDMEGLAEVLRDAQVQVLVLKEDKPVDRDPGEVGFVLICEVDGYRIYELPETDLNETAPLRGSAEIDEDDREGDI